MGNLSTTIPFTELWERLISMGKIDSPNQEDFARGLINDVYSRIIPRIEDWKPLVQSGYLSMSAFYNTGYVSISAGSTSLTGTSTVWTAGMIATSGYKIKFSGNDNIYTFTYVSSTTATISPALSGDRNLTNVSYVIYRDEYSLPADFDRFLKNGSIYVYSNGRIVNIIQESDHECFVEDMVSDPSDPIRNCKLTRTHPTTGYRLIKVNPPPRSSKVYPFEYIQKVTPMRDYHNGTVSLTNGSPTVLGAVTSWLANVSAGDYFRANANGRGDSSKWYKILSVNSNTSITLEENYGEDTEAYMEYSISKSPTAYPSEFHEYILYEALYCLVSEQSDPNTQPLTVRREEILKDLKKNYKSRRTNTQFRVEDDGYRS